MPGEKEDRPDRLTHKWILNNAKPGRHGEGRGGNGLYIRITERPGGRITRTWCQRIRIKGRVTNLGLGSFPTISLARARAIAADNVRRVAQGEDIREPAPKTPTLNEVIDEMVTARSLREPTKKTVDDWYRLKAYCEPIGSKPVSDVTMSDILRTVEPLWIKKNRTAHDVRDFLAAAMRRAIRYGYRTDNPATSDITEDLGKPTPTVHHESLPHADVGKNLAIIRDAPVWWAVKYGLEFLAFTSVRSEKVRAAEWEQFHLESDQPTWNIPKTKNGLPHDVPLSTHAVEILLYAEAKTGGHGLVFPPERSAGTMDKGRFAKFMKKLHIPAVPHGFRSSFRNWAGGRADISEPVAERVLAHKPPTKPWKPTSTLRSSRNGPRSCRCGPTTSPRPWGPLSPRTTSSSGSDCSMENMSLPTMSRLPLNVNCTDAWPSRRRIRRRLFVAPVSTRRRQRANRTTRGRQGAAAHSRLGD